MSTINKQAWVTVYNKPGKVRQVDWENRGFTNFKDYVRSLFNEGVQSLAAQGAWDERKVNKYPYVRFIDWESQQEVVYLSQSTFEKEFEDTAEAIKINPFFKKMIDLKN